MKENLTCSNCGTMFLTDELTEFDGLTLCKGLITLWVIHV